MKKEEARIIVEQLDNYLSHTCQDYGDSDHEAMMMAIEALEQESCEDAISREAILNDLKECMEVSESNYEFGEVEGLRKAIESVNEMTSVQPKIKTGHWIPKSKNWWECSECGRMIYSETESDKLKFHAFCGRCGARMIEPRESEEV